MNHLDKEYLDEQIVLDMLLVIAAIVSIGSYAIYSVGSVFLGTMGMLMIFMNFGPALILYRYISQFKYFGVFCILYNVLINITCEIKNVIYSVYVMDMICI